MGKLIYCVLILLMLFSLSSCNNKEETFYLGETDTYTIKTEYCNLEYPKKWEADIEVKYKESSPYTVKFYSAEDVHLFDICFNDASADVIGEVSLDGKNVKIGVKTYEIKEAKYDSEEYEKLCTMQEDVNVILSKLIENNDMRRI